MTKHLNLFWAKTSDYSASEYLSLLQHSLDISGIITNVSDSLLAPATRKFLSDMMGEVPMDVVLKLAACAHDIGKASPFFQQKNPTLSMRVAAAGFDGAVTPNQMSANPHSIISAHTLIAWLGQRTGNRLDPITKEFWFAVIAGHHGTFNPFKSPSDDLAQEMRRSSQWQEARFELLDVLIGDAGLSEEDIQRCATLFNDADDKIIPNAVAALTTGVLIAADWVASSTENFPLISGQYQDPGERLDNARVRINLGGRWQPSPVDSAEFISRFALPKSAALRNVQQAVIEVGNAQTRPSFTIIENETGSGKTEAALALADITASKFGFNGLFFAQPTRVTSDAIFSRVAQWLSQSGSPESVSTVLAHGKSEFNDEFREVTSSGFSSIHDDDVPADQTQLEATQWFQGRKTGLLASVVVGTIDQILFATLQSRHNVLRHLGLAGKVVIIDEIHAADSYMRVYTTCLLEWLGLYGVPVIALSATLPPAMRKELLDAYYSGASGYDGTGSKLDDSPVYPRITWTDGHTTETIAPEHDGLNRTTHVIFSEGDLPEMAAKALDLSTDGGCIGIICSTVSRAQELYCLISAQEDATVLLHARFLTSDRVDLEGSLVHQLGRQAGDARPKKLIVVSTQIIEQGLDLDFDAMISDIAPTDLIIQRIGRLHRHPVLNELRPETLKKPTLSIFGAGIPDTTGPAPSMQKGSVRVYRSAPLLRSLSVLADHLQESYGRITTPVDVEKLVSVSYDTERAAPAGWVEQWAQAHRNEMDFEKSQIKRAELARIPKPESEDLAGWSRQPSIADEQAAAGQVRDADESFEVIVVRNVNGRLYALPHVRELDGMPVDGTMELDYSVARNLARCTVRLPGWTLSDDDLGDLESDGQESWQQSRWLKGMLPLVLDETLSREVERYVFRYDEQLGLLVERKEKE
ncbi:CRISPR-associated helicase Cas3' [Corynebacterium hylobatis]|uniref:CRISPR-associated helicase Cas3 n=1 Tax=Corynebacterium hylobatis TaxID=1859290 RepID=A0A3S0HGZ1_9CORY|nr:CRISPR-associated helicase Cas3' [Corynebacterium hylobatis]RSZ63187.1 CRISPR-associated helicase Cas3' [Corynebacterium hylobatis]